ncbi:MAG TPA: glycosyltransferase [Sedimentisphaerales bacterium]|nr:glycosyltransferase [Sedimentisphaerales bacterium]HQG49345.1 glycosyltransferase [Sedimentisphaerales bacterium]
MLKFSLVTTCRNEIDSLPRWKQDILAQTRQPDEIVIVDAFSDDGTAEMLFDWARNDERVVVIQEKGNAAHGRNFAIERAKHEHILSTDMGVRLCPVWCEELIKPFEADPDVEIVAGSTQIDKETVKTAAARAEYYIENGGEPRLGSGFVPGNRSVAYTKTVWRELGGLPEDLTFYADDSVFGRQMVHAGYKMAYAPKAMTYWGRPSRLRDFCKEQYNYGRGDGEAGIKTPFAFTLYAKSKIPRSLVPFFTGIRGLQKHLRLSAVVRALRAADFPALAMMPVLLFCRNYSFGKGYLIGDAHGLDHCRDCRRRLKDPKWAQAHRA